MTDTTTEAVERLAGEERGQRLLVAALAICATGRKTASPSLCAEAQKQLSALWSERDTLAARVAELEAEVAELRAGVKIKPLVWLPPIPKQGSTEHLTECGRYKVVEWYDKSGHVLYFARSGRPTRIDADTSACGSDVLKSAAQADHERRIAQADHERRIREALA